MVRKKKRKRVTKDCLTIRTPTNYPKNQQRQESISGQVGYAIRASWAVRSHVAHAGILLSVRIQGVGKGRSEKGGRKAGVAEERGQEDAVWKVKETHTSASRWLMQRGEIFISLPAWLGGAGQPTLYIS